MDARLRLTFFCGSCLGLAVGFAAGHVSVWQRVGHSRSTGLLLNNPGGHAASVGVGGFDFPEEFSTLPPEVHTRIPVPGGAVVLNDPDLGDEPVHADALVEVPPSADDGLPYFPRTDELPTPPLPFSMLLAKPLSHPSISPLAEPVREPPTTQLAQATSPELPPLDPEVAEMLKDELDGVSEQQREVWADALRGMSPGDAAGVILMWKKFGQKGAGHVSSPPPMFDASHPDDAPAPLRHLSPNPAIGADLGFKLNLHNQANRETCGYLKMVPVFQEVAFHKVEGNQHAQVVSYRLEIKPGRLVETGNPAHVAVQRECFFAVKLPTGEEQYTRVGRLVLDAERRLCIDVGDRDLPLSPEVKLPQGATRFTFQNGQLSIAVEGQAEPTAVGPLQVAEFFDASRLLPMGSSLYSASTASGQAKMVPAELVFQTLEYPLIEGPALMTEARQDELAPLATARRE